MVSPLSCSAAEKGSLQVSTLRVSVGASIALASEENLSCWTRRTLGILAYVWPDGSSYEGGFKGGLPHGRGIHKTAADEKGRVGKPA